MRTRTSGSSPLTRGKPEWMRGYMNVIGLIPAHAGKTCYRRCTGESRGAHPRSRGENCHAILTPVSRAGSSPLTRGKLVVASAVTRPWGLIPAHAGKTRKRTRPPRRPRAHPRSRGENDNGACNTVHGSGSSPLTRGKRAPVITPYGSGGLIPAHAGKTRSRIYSGRSVWAHPRSRGENWSSLLVHFLFEGSSPLTRGKHQRP